MIYLMMQKNGMGNQMFTYAFGRALQELYASVGERERIAVNPYRFYHGDDRDYIDERHISLQNFVLTEEIDFLKGEEMETCNAQKRSAVLKAVGPIGVLQRKLDPKRDLGEAAYLKRSERGIYELHEPRAYYEMRLSKEKDKYVQGLFQNHRYFDGIREALRGEFAVKTPASAENADMLKRIQSCNAVCIHVRRGDYLNPHWAKLNICDLAYYQEAVRQVARRVKDPVFFVFSNTHEDIEWIRESFPFTRPEDDLAIRTEYVDLSNPDYEELRLMCGCRHFIMPNSTFSWWAAYLSEKPDSVICAPDRWDLEIPGDAGMNMPGWTVLPTGK